MPLEARLAQMERKLADLAHALATMIAAQRAAADLAAETVRQTR